jgi:molybdopterin/thiamine biosynthesis adenylyltransferase
MFSARFTDLKGRFPFLIHASAHVTGVYSLRYQNLNFQRNVQKTGVFGVLPGVIGTLQATEVIKIAIGIGEPLYGKILFYDGLAAQFHSLVVSKNETCCICGKGSDIKNLADFGR